MWFQNVNVGGLNMLVIEQTSPWIKFQKSNTWIRRNSRGYITDEKSQQEIVDLIRSYEKREGYEFRVNGYTLNIVFDPCSYFERKLRSMDAREFRVEHGGCKCNENCKCERDQKNSEIDDLEVEKTLKLPLTVVPHL